MARKNEPGAIEPMIDTLYCPLCSEQTLEMYENEYGKCSSCDYEGKVRVEKVDQEPENLKCVIHNNEVYCAYLPEDENE